MRVGHRSRWTVFHVAFVLVMMGQGASLAGGLANEVFERYKDRVVQIRILEASSGAKTIIGSGFIVDGQGHIVTNYHVISDLVYTPDKYRAEIVHNDKSVEPATLLNFDAIHDLAVVQSDARHPTYFTFQPRPLGQGVQIFSLGTPMDLGFTIVEGTYSGLLADSLYDNIHFTGSINPGMSGGPAILEDGRVVGVNVATAGNQISFLVPAKYVQALLQATAHESVSDHPQRMEQLRDQLLANQSRYMEALLANPLPTTKLGPYRVPGNIPGVVKCWGDSSKEKEHLYETVTWQCNAENTLYISRSLRSGTLHFGHNLISTHTLDRFRFFGLYQQFFGRSQSFHGDKKEVGRFHCTSSVIDHDSLTLKAVMCLRGYKKLPGLYDAVIKAATLDEEYQGVQTTLTLGGVSFENATRFARHYLSAISREDS